MFHFALVICMSIKIPRNFGTSFIMVKEEENGHYHRANLVIILVEILGFNSAANEEKQQQIRITNY